MAKKTSSRPQKSTEASTGSAVLRPRARIIQTLGRDLIANEVVALQELVKNAYDADATKVEITFHDPLRPKSGAIVITDNGFGMDLETIRNSWMEPATISKTAATRTPGGRRVTGEKGIGRFAAARVADILELATQRQGGRDHVKVRFDWSKFEDPSRYLDEVACSWQIEPSNDTRPGTTLVLSGVKDEWNAERFERLRAELARLIDPLGSEKFQINLVIPGIWKDFSGPITSPEVLGKPHYRLVGSINESGELTARYQGPGGNGDEELLDNEGKRPVLRLSEGRRPSCGPFKFEFRVWDRQREDLEPLARDLSSTVRDIRHDLDSASGISVYRDNFRVLIPENDWLRLDLRRVQNPTIRLSNNQIVGRVSISADTNNGLKDQSNRQGIIDSPQLEDFKNVLKDILARLEVRRDNYRRRGTQEPVATPGIFAKLRFTPVRSYLLQRYPKDAELRAFLDDHEKQFEEGVGEVQKVIARYRRLATLGQLIDVVLHEGRTPLSTIKNEAALAEDDLSGTAVGLKEQLSRRLDRIIYQTDVLETLFKRLAPFSGRKRGKPIDTTIEQLVAETFALEEERIRHLGVTAQLPDTNTAVRVDPSEMQMIFLNLLDNSLYWLEKVSAGDRKINVAVRRTPDGIEVIFSDSGPGVGNEARDRVFDPYFSMKPEGVGLGLTIAGETASEYDGSLDLLDGGPLPGATFRVLLRSRLGLENG